MRSMAVKVIAAALSAFILFMPADLSAKERRGSTVVVTRLDGTQVSGELIAVKPESLLLLSGQGRDETIDKTEIKSIRIVRKSRAGKGALYGSLGGALIMGALASGGVDEYTGGQAAFIFGAFFGAIGGLGGLGMGAIMGVDTTMTVDGEPAEVVADIWYRLQKHARAGSPVAVTKEAREKPDSAQQSPVPAPAATEAAPPGARHKPRFKISLSGVAGSPEGPDFQGVGSFRFPEEAPPEDGPYSMSFQDLNAYLYDQKNITIGPISLAYEWEEHWSAEIEFLAHRTSFSYLSSDLEFTSGADGMNYSSSFFDLYRVRFVSLLAGLTYRPFAPSAFRRHIVEAGAAIGPAFVSSEGYHPLALFSALGDFRKTVLSGRAHAAYDFYVVPAFSIGAFAGYRYMETSFSGVVSSTNLLFHTGGDAPNEIVRPTEISLENLPLRAGGIFWGFRVGFRI